MRTYTAAISIFILCYFVACNKSSDDIISIRIKNNTTEEFKEIIANNKSYLHVVPSAVTSYQQFTQVADLAAVTLINNNNDTAYAGSYYIDPPVTYLSNGKYTLEVFEDTATYYGYNCRYIKD